MTQKFTVEARELHPVTGEPLGEWWGDGELVDRVEAVRWAEAIERPLPDGEVWRARIRPYVPPYYVETP